MTGRLAKLGYVLQLLPDAGLLGTTVGTSGLIYAIKEEGMLGYLNSTGWSCSRYGMLMLVLGFSRPGEEIGNSVLEDAWQGGPLTDAMVAAVTL